MAFYLPNCINSHLGYFTAWSKYGIDPRQRNTDRLFRFRHPTGSEIRTQFVQIKSWDGRSYGGRKSEGTISSYSSQWKHSLRFARLPTRLCDWCLELGYRASGNRWSKGFGIGLCRGWQSGKLRNGWWVSFGMRMKMWGVRSMNSKGWIVSKVCPYFVSSALFWFKMVRANSALQSVVYSLHCKYPVCLDNTWWDVWTL